MRIHPFIDKVFQRQNQLILVLALGLLHGLIYVFVIPPWWHHEEPGHFEYAWLVANRPGWPQLKDYDNGLRQQIAESMIDSGQKNLYNLSKRDLRDDPIKLGGSPVGRKGAYYWLLSLPLWLVKGQDVLLQLYIARLTSLGLFLLSLWFSWLLMGELVEEGHPLHWMVPAFLALLPGYVDNMTSVHDDVIGGAVGAFFLWLSVHGIRKGFSLPSLVGWLAAVGLCVVARDTTMPLALLAPIVPLAWLLKKRTVPVLGIGLLLTALLLGALVFTFRDASQWYFFPVQQASNRVKDSQAPFGAYAFSLTREASTAPEFGQSFAPNDIKRLREKTLTLGVWIWADTPAQISLPVLNYRTPVGLAGSPGQKVKVGTTPAFYSTTIEIPFEAGHAWLTPLPDFRGKSVQVFYDGFVLAEGQYSSSPPQFENERLHSGVWDGKPFQNLIRNPSAEQAWLGLRDSANLLQQRFYLDPTLFLQTMQDLKGFGWYHRLAFSSLFQTFWGRGAAAQVPLAGEYSYSFLQLVSFISVLGLFHYLWRNRTLLLRPELFFLAGALLIIWIPAFFRGTYWVFYYVPLVPYARYAYPAFIPVALLICAGCLEALRWLQARFALPESFPVLAFSSFLVGLACYAIFSFGGYFYPWLKDLGYLVLFLSVISVIFMLLKNLAQAENNLAEPKL